MNEDRIVALEARLKKLEDEREIARLIGAYGPLVDSGSASETAELWSPDGVYDVDEIHLDGRDQIAAMVHSEAHQGLIHNGCAHLLGSPHVTVDDDEAVAVCHSLLIVRAKGRYVVRRATANHWLLRRGEDGWRVAARTSRILDGGAQSRALLGAVAELNTAGLNTSEGHAE